ncbi:Neutral/alkaline non-lysosomal ceramidase [Rubripirellula lacrimiformis]|uniref:Neutral/alkaline non-lysosomal ceramidase n=1 Tax=Rubripirellula lacrimiformis TaxID=1930273 RepID=A0A517NAF6_9BACT|nr:neutral/alkaline non-lysosomal ceramidase N-terminal domain-containing protein [Rubripirellula lacrimiformis]QDT04110.1 Neutral/alkaline non-lysosomal ceramidase [Rubripirellula lacrimiformis]
MKPSTFVFSAVAVAAFLILPSRFTHADESDKVFLAGASTSNITPPLGDSIVGNWEPIPATNVHDELHARCLVLDNGQDRLAFVICDNVGIPAEVFDAAKEQVLAATGMPASHVLMASTHTHSATSARGSSKTIRTKELNDYQKFVAHRISDGVRRAIANMEPARIGWGRTEEPSEVFNRRWHVNNVALLNNPLGGVDQVRMNPPRGHEALDRPAGPTDPEICFISVQSTDGRPIALLANYSLHYVGGVPNGDISADYFGYFANKIEKKLNASEQTPPFVGILSNGTSGDINNNNYADKNPKKYKSYEKMAEVAEKVASRVAEAHNDLTFHDWVPLAAASTNLPLKVRQPTPEMLEHLKPYMEAKDTKSDGPRKKEQIYAGRIANILESPKQIEVPLQAFRIGDLGISAIPFEAFAEIGLELKDRSPTGETFTIELANGSFGYLPTPYQHRLGGYETWLGTNSVELKASDKIIASLLKLLEQPTTKN